MTSVKPLAMLLALALGLVAILFGHWSRMRAPRRELEDEQTP